MNDTIFMLISKSSHETGHSMNQIAKEWGFGDQALAKDFDDGNLDWVTEDEKDGTLLDA